MAIFAEFYKNQDRLFLIVHQERNTVSVLPPSLCCPQLVIASTRALSPIRCECEDQGQGEGHVCERVAGMDRAAAVEEHRHEPE
jgi:hypothetical protein